MGKRISVWICKGCGIGEAVDAAALAKAAGGAGAASCRDHPRLCGEEGRALLREDARGGDGALVVAACSPRFLPGAFAFEGCRTEWVNLREHVAWSHEPGHEDTQMLAEDYVRMGIVRAEKAEAPEAVREETDRTILVVGGGAAGMGAALDAARAGYGVVLVEKEAALGGWMALFSRGIPHDPPYRDPAPTGAKELAAEVAAHPRIQVRTGTTVERISGQPGRFDVTLRNGSASGPVRVGAVIQATGWVPYDASRLGHLGHGRFPDVITSVRLEQMLAQGRVERPGGGGAPRRIAFVQCAGSRDENHLPYCSAVCCRVTLKQALQVRALDPEAEVLVLYRDLRATGLHEDFYRRAQEDPGIFFTRAEVSGVEAAAGGGLEVRAKDTLLGADLALEADLVVLATGMVPRAVDGEAARKYIDAKAVIAKGEAGAQLDAAKEAAGRLAHLEGRSILNLDYRQGPELPALRHGFPDSHFICFPYETRRTGIYAAGCLRAPGDSRASRDDGTGAAMKAIQAVEAVAAGRAVHPRWGDMSSPAFALQRCTQCKRCTEECPFGTLNEDAKGTPQPNPGRCRRCGICMGACPERIISFRDYSVEILSSQIKATHIPDEFSGKPRILGFLCENDAYPALDAAGMRRIRHSAFIRFLPVRCIGSVNVVFVADALARGFDGILMLGCRSGLDYQCHFVRGSELMGTRSTNIREKLKQLALEEERVLLEEVSIADVERLPRVIDAFVERIAALGPSPFKGF